MPVDHRKIIILKKSFITVTLCSVLFCAAYYHVTIILITNYHPGVDLPGVISRVTSTTMNLYAINTVLCHCTACGGPFTTTAVVKHTQRD